MERNLDTPNFLRRGNGKAPPLPGPGEPVDYAQPHHREAAQPAPPKDNMEQARDNHHHAADTIENDAQIMKEHAVHLRKLVREGLDRVGEAAASARKVAELACVETRGAVDRAIEAHNQAVDAYIELCKEQGDTFRSDGEKLLDVVKRADAKCSAKTQAILNAGEEQPETPQQAQA